MSCASIRSQAAVSLYLFTAEEQFCLWNCFKYTWNGLITDLKKTAFRSANLSTQPHSFLPVTEHLVSFVLGVFVLFRKRSGGSALTGGWTNEKSTKWTEDCKWQSGARDEEETLHLRGQRQVLGCVLRLPFKRLRREWMDHLVNASWYEWGTQNWSVKQRTEQPWWKKNVIIVILPFAESFVGIKLDYKD